MSFWHKDSLIILLYFNKQNIKKNITRPLKLAKINHKISNYDFGSHQIAFQINQRRDSINMIAAYKYNRFFLEINIYIFQNKQKI